MFPFDSRSHGLDDVSLGGDDANTRGVAHEVVDECARRGAVVGKQGDQRSAIAPARLRTSASSSSALLIRYGNRMLSRTFRYSSNSNSWKTRPILAMRKARRADGKIALLELTQALERYFTENNTYVGASLGGGAGDIYPATSPEGHYSLSFTNGPSATGFTVQAAPQGAQTGDTRCANLTLTATGVKGASGTGTVADCW